MLSREALFQALSLILTVISSTGQLPNFYQTTIRPLGNNFFSFLLVPVWVRDHAFKHARMYTLTLARKCTHQHALKIA